MSKGKFMVHKRQTSTLGVEDRAGGIEGGQTILRPDRTLEYLAHKKYGGGLNLSFEEEPGLQGGQGSQGGQGAQGSSTERPGLSLPSLNMNAHLVPTLLSPATGISQDGQSLSYNINSSRFERSNNLRDILS